MSFLNGKDKLLCILYKYVLKICPVKVYFIHAMKWKILKTHGPEKTRAHRGECSLLLKVKLILCSQEEKMRITLL